MRFGVLEEKTSDVGESDSTVTPVVLGDSGEAMIGEGSIGIVRRFRYVGVLCSSKLLVDFGGVLGIDANEEGWKSSFGLKVLEVGDLVELGGLMELSSAAAASLDLSSHLPLTASRLFVTRCDGVHLLVLAGVDDPPVGVVKMLMPDCCELLRERVPPRVEEVRSSSRV